MITVRPFKENDTIKIDARVDNFSIDKGSVEIMACTGKAFTFVRNNTPIAILGGSILVPGCWQIWSLMSDSIRSEGLYLTRMAIAILDKFAELNNIHRYQTAIDPLEDENERWIEALGFEFESVMIKATSKKTDVLMYTMFPEEDNYVKRWRKNSRLQNDIKRIFRLDG